MNRVEKYYTPEQMEWLKERRETVGDERIREVEAEWPRLMAEVRAAIDAGTDPSDPHVQALAARWQGLVQEFTDGNPGIEKSLRTMYAERVTAGDPPLDGPSHEGVRRVHRQGGSGGEGIAHPRPLPEREGRDAEVIDPDSIYWLRNCPRVPPPAPGGGQGVGSPPTPDAAPSRHPRR